MGVHGLWQLLQAAGQSVSLESLEGKVLAVDVSIWLHQTMKGMRDKDGNPLPNAHLQGLFSRICKLLFYRIRPVFVFDGGVPALKKQTMVARRERKAEAERESNEISQKLLQNLIKSHAVGQTLGDMGGPSRRVPGIHKGRGQADNDMFALPPLAESEEIGLALNAEEWDKDFELQEHWIKEGLATISDTHLDSEELRSLPMEIQHEILNELREQKKYHSLSRLTKMPEDSTDFSTYQLKKLMKQSMLTTRIQEVRKQMTSKTSGDITCSLGDEYHGDEVEARRIVSEDTAHYVLIKGLTKKRQQEEADRYEIQTRVKLEKVEQGDLNNLITVGPGEGQCLGNDKSHSGDIISFGSNGNGHPSKTIFSDSDSDLESVLARRLRRKRLHKSKSSRSGQKTNNRGQVPAALKQANQIVSDDEDEAIPCRKKRRPADGSCSSTEDEGFIEVRVNPSAAIEDDLFPASIFQTDFRGNDEITSGADSEICQREADSARSDTNQTGDTFIGGNRTINPDLLQPTGVTKDLNKDSMDIACDDKKAEHDEFSTVTEDITLKRRNILNEILSQLEEKKKLLKESQEDMNADSEAFEEFSIGGGFVKEILSPEQDEISAVTEEKVTHFPTVSEPENIQQGSGNFFSNTTDDKSSLSESDEDLKIAIELSLQTARSGKEIFDSLSGSKKDTAVIKHNNMGTDKVGDQCLATASSVSDGDMNDFVEVEPDLPFTQSPNDITKDSGSSDEDGEENLQEVAEDDSDKSPHSDEISCTVMENGEGALNSEQSANQKTSQASVGRQVKTHSIDLQPEDYEIDYNGASRTVHEDVLEDARARLESERSVLLSERGRHTRMAASVTEQTNLEAQELLRLFGIPFIISPMEAEAQCAYLDITNQTQGTITDDSDVWLFGGSRVYKNFFNQSKHVEFYTFDSVHNYFGLSRAQLISIALFCGSDYTEGIPGIGPVRALEIMAEFPGEGLEGLYSFRRWWDRAKSQIFSVGENKIRARLKDLKVIPGFPSQAVVDAYLCPQVDDSTEKFTWGTPDLDMLRDFAKYRFGWSKEKSDQSLLPMMKQLSNRERQGKIHSYFQSHHLVQNSKIKSLRLKKALALVKNPKQPSQRDTKAENSTQNDHVEENEMGDKSKKGKKDNKRKVGENNVDSSSTQRKQRVTDKQRRKETIKTRQTASATQAEKEIVRVKVEDAGKEVMTIGITESEAKKVEAVREAVGDTEKDTFKVGVTMEKDQKQVRKKTTTRNKKQIMNEDNRKSSTQLRGIRFESAGEQTVAEENQRKDEVGVVHKLNQRHQDMGDGSTTVQNVKINMNKRGRGRSGQGTMKGRGKMLVSLDHKQKSRSRDQYLRKAGISTGRAAVNLSGSSNSSESCDGDEQWESDMCPVTTMVKQKQNSKHKLATRACNDLVGQATQLETGQYNKVVESPKEKLAKVTLESGQNSKRKNIAHSSRGNKIYQESNNTDHLTDKMPNLMAAKQNSRSNQDDSLGGEEEVNINLSKADVSVINKQNLSSTLTYLNHRSKDDQLLLQQLVGKRTVNAFEKRLEESERRSRLEKQQLERINQAAGQTMSFGDILGGLDAGVTKSIHSMGQKVQTSQKSARPSTSQKDNINPTKTFQDRILQQIGQFGTVLVGASSKDGPDTKSTGQTDNGVNKSGSDNQFRSDLKTNVAISVLDNPLVKDLAAPKIFDEKALFNSSNEMWQGKCTSTRQNIQSQNIQSVQDGTFLKSNKSKAFDMPIDEMSDCSSESLDGSRAGKLSKKKKFLKQMEHLGDSKSVKGHGLLPRQSLGQGIRGRAVAGKGKGRGKNRNNMADVSGDSCIDRLQSEVSEVKHLEYAFMTEEDLGSDFSECET